MSKKKLKKQINKSINYLIKYANRPLWDNRKQQLYDELYNKAAHHLNISTDTLLSTLEPSAYIDIAHAYLFELFSTYHWDEDNQSLIGAYLQHQGWKETPYGKRYLQAIDNSHIELWQIISISAGQSIDIRPAGTKQPPIRVYECSATEQLQDWEYIAARVVNIDTKKEFSSAILPFTLDQAVATHSMLTNVYDQTTDNLHQIRTETSQYSSTEIQSIATASVNSELPQFLFSLWIKQVYLALTQKS